MFDDETQARTALHPIADTPPPPATTTVTEVIRRGRRRVFVQRTAAVAGVVAVVAGIGIGAAQLANTPSGMDSAATTVAPPPTDPPIPGWTWIPVPGPENGEETCRTGHSEHPEPDLPLPPRDLVESTLVAEVAEVVATNTESPVADHLIWDGHDEQTGGPWGLITVNFPMGDGLGHVSLEVDRYGGTPTEAADAEVAANGTCLPPSRGTMPDGTVLQLYQPAPTNPGYLNQFLRVYAPNGRLYVLSDAPFGVADNVAVPGDTDRLPLTDAQLVEIGTKLAALGR